MRHILLFAVLLLICFSQLLAQPKVVKEMREAWIADSQHWVPVKIRILEYNALGIQMLDKVEQKFNEDSIPENTIVKKFNEFGKFLSREEVSLKNVGEEIIRDDYVYNEGKKLIERTGYKMSISRIDTIPIYKWEYTYFPSDLKFVVKNYDWNQTNGGYELEKIVDSTFYENGLLWKVETNYPSIPYQSRMSYYYLDDGKKIHVTYESLSDPQAGWRSGYEIWEWYDDNFRILWREISDWNVSPSPIEYYAYKYDAAGRLVYEANYDNAFFSFLDSTLFVDDAEGRLQEKKIFKFRDGRLASPIRHILYHYDCEDNLSIETEDVLPQVFRTTYTYDVEVPCEPPVDTTYTGPTNIFPNPSNGQFEIQSNLLIGSKAVIHIFSSMGKEVYAESVDKISGHKQLDLSGLSPGNYYLIIQNGNLSASKRILILE